MKILFIVLGLCFLAACKHDIENKRHVNIKKDYLAETKLNIGLPKTYTDTLSLISYTQPDAHYDTRFLKIDYKKKLDSLYEVIDEELNVIDFENHFKADARKSLDQLKQSYILDQKASYNMWNSCYGINYRSQRIDPNSFKRIEQMIYKRRYEELLIYNYSLRGNLTRLYESYDSYRKRLKDVMPKKVLDSMYPKKGK
jgi:hypothetical protein